MMPTDEQIADLKQKHGELTLYESGPVRVICRTPRYAEVDHWRDGLAKSRYEKRSPHYAMLSFLQSIAVFPAPEQFSELMVSERSRLIDIADSASALATSADEVSEKKL